MSKDKLNLRKAVAIAICLAGMTMFSGCDTEENESSAISVADNSSLTQETFADNEQGSSGVTFTTTGAWTSSISEVSLSAQSVQMRSGTNPSDWISISPDHGNSAGTYTIAIILETNMTGADRTAIITISCNGTDITITITQKGITEDGEVPTPNIKLVNRIDEYWYQGSTDPNANLLTMITHEYQYDAQNDLTKVVVTKKGSKSIMSTETEMINYSSANTIVLSGPMCPNGSVTLTLNSDGAIASMPIVDPYELYESTNIFTYANGYLQKSERAVKKTVGIFEVIDGEWISVGVEVINGTNTTSYMWGNGNVKTEVFKRVYPTHPDENVTISRNYEYGTELNKPSNMDVARLVKWGEFLYDSDWYGESTFKRSELHPAAWLGKSTTNLPSKVTWWIEDHYSTYTTTYRYETDSEGYVTKIFGQDLYEDGAPTNDGERLLYVIGYR